jgi:hypothetical protein
MTKNTLSTQRLRQADAYLGAWAWRCFALPCLLPLVLHCRRQGSALLTVD